MKKDVWIRLRWKIELRGELVSELKPDEYGVWVRLRLLCGECPYQPYIQIKKNLGFNDVQIAKQLSVETRLWLRTKDKLLHYNRIRVEEGNVIRVMHWDKYMGSYMKRVMYRDGRKPEKHNLSRASDEAKELYELRRRIITYLNDKTGKSFKVSSMVSLRYINARRREGATFKEFQHAIDAKVHQWKGTKKELWLRPITLFNDTNFWHFVNEPLPKIKMLELQEDPYSAFNPEERRKIPKLKKEYKERLKETMREMGWVTEGEIDWEQVPTEVDFIKNGLRKARK